MSTEENKASVRRLNEAINKGDFSYLSEFFTPDYVFHTVPEVKGPEGVKQMFTAVKAAFPDYHEEIKYVIAEGELVAVFDTLSGTFKGKYGEIEPTGKGFSVPNVVLSRFENGKQVEAWPYADSLIMYRQLGMPVPE